MKIVKNLSKKASAKNNNLSTWVFPSLVMLVLLFFVSSISDNSTKSNTSSRDKNPDLKAIELNPNYISQNQAKAQSEAPYYGLQDQTVNQEQVIINLSDNGFQDGDVVTMSVNDRVVVKDHYLLNKGTEILLSVRPGVNLVKIYGTWDGAQNGMGISLSADVAGQGNATNSLFPENATAIFKIIRQ